MPRKQSMGARLVKWSIPMFHREPMFHTCLGLSLPQGTWDFLRILRLFSQLARFAIKNGYRADGVGSETD